MVAGVLSISLVWWMGTHKTLEDAHNRSTDSELVHGNDDRNNRLHIVYEIYGINKTGDYTTIKYGITCQKNFVSRWGNPRPEYQIPYYQMIFPYLKVGYKILHSNIQSRMEAKRIEKSYVSRYYSKYGEMPLKQKRPKLFL